MGNNKGVTSKDRICIYGGGYAALMGVTREPELYQCVIGSAGVYDLPLELDEADINDARAGISFLKSTRGTDINALKNNSPVYNVSKIKVPLLLPHGTKGSRVPIEHLERLTKALDLKMHEYKKLVFENEGHGYANDDNRNKFYNTMLDFLKHYIGQ